MPKLTAAFPPSRHHPDKVAAKGGDSKEATGKFREIQESYEVLADDGNKAAYHAEQEEEKQAARDWAAPAREEEARKKEAGERNAQEVRLREQALRERAAWEKAQLDKANAERENATREKAVQETARREGAAREKRVMKNAAGELERKESESRERAAQEKAAREKAAGEQRGREEADEAARGRRECLREIVVQIEARKKAREEDALARRCSAAAARYIQEDATWEEDFWDQAARNRLARAAEREERAARSQEAKIQALRERRKLKFRGFRWGWSWGLGMWLICGANDVELIM